MRFIFIISILGIIFYSCQKDIVAPDIVINIPVKVNALPVKNGIKVEFYGNNNEEGFKGYNIYINRNSDIKKLNLSPVNNNTYPTLPYYYSTCYYDGRAKSYVTLYKDSHGSSISNHQLYYITVRAVTILNDRTNMSDYSEEVSVYTIEETNFILNNNNISGITNDGIDLNGNIYPVNALDNGSGADIVFKLININNKILPAFILKSTLQIQDKGVVNNIFDIEDIPQEGYYSISTNIIFNNHIYLIKKDNNIYRIYIQSGAEEKNSLTDNISISVEAGG